MSRSFGELGQPGADFDAYQLECAAASLIFRADEEVEAERESIERAIQLLTERLSVLPSRPLVRRGDNHG